MSQFNNIETTESDLGPYVAALLSIKLEKSLDETLANVKTVLTNYSVKAIDILVSRKMSIAHQIQFTDKPIDKIFENVLVESNNIKISNLAHFVGAFLSYNTFEPYEISVANVNTVLTNYSGNDVDILLKRQFLIPNMIQEFTIRPVDIQKIFTDVLNYDNLENIMYLSTWFSFVVSNTFGLEYGDKTAEFHQELIRLSREKINNLIAIKELAGNMFVPTSASVTDVIQAFVDGPIVYNKPV